MDRGSESPELQIRNVEVFDSGGAVIAGTCLWCITLFIYGVDIVVRILAAWHSPVGRVLQIPYRIHRDYGSLGDFPV